MTLTATSATNAQTHKKKTQTIKKKMTANPPPPPTMNETLLGYYSNAQVSKQENTALLQDFVDAIRSSEYAAQVAAIRNAKNEELASKLKRALPCISISGSVKDNGPRSKAAEEGRFIHSGLIQLDFDAADNVGWDIPEIAQIIQGDPRVVVSFISPTGTGVKGVARINVPPNATIDQHKRAFIAVRDYFAGFNLFVDEACKDPVRLCFVSHDPNAWCDLTRTAAFDPAPADSMPQAAPPPAPAPNQRKSYDAPTLVLSARSDAFPEPPYQGIHTWLLAAAWWCRFHELTEDDARDKLKSYDGTLRRAFQPREVDDAIRKAYDAPRPKSDSDWQAVERVLAATTRRPSQSTYNSFDPEDIYYDAPAAKYLIRVGNAFHTYSRVTPVITGVTRFLADQHDGDPKGLLRAVKAAIASREVDGGIQWSGRIAGMAQGMALDSAGMPILITSEAQPPEPAESSDNWPVIGDLLNQAFADPTAQAVFCAWLAGRWRAVRSHVHIPSPMLVLAGEVNSGKSLLAWIIGQMLGGRVANPYSAWSGGMLWNDDLIGSELLLVDDCSASTDIRARRAFGAAFKEAMYPFSVQLRKRHSSSVSVRPVWACVVCCNDTPEALQIIPPIDADMSDKVALLHVSQITMPVDTSTAAGRGTLQAMIKAELPSFAKALDDMVVPDDLHDTRSGVKAWRDPVLSEASDAQSPHRRLEALIETSLSNRGVWHDLPRDFTALEIETRLLDRDSPVREQARGLFTWHGACGSALTKLTKGGSKLVARSDTANGVRYYIKG